MRAIDEGEKAVRVSDVECGMLSLVLGASDGIGFFLSA